jgi:hypothetical protein
MSGPLSGLEVRLEVFKSIDNAEFDFLQRVCDRRSIVERYRRNKIELHIHYLAGDRGWCAKYRQFSIGKFRVARESEQFNTAFVSDIYEFPMLIFVRNRTQRICPSAAIVRLQQLQLCEMAGIDSFEGSSLSPRPEVLAAVYNRKLRSILGNSATVESCQFKNEVFEGSSQIISNLADENSDCHRNNEANSNAAALLPFLGLEVSDEGVCLFPFKRNNPWPKIRKVFFCPIDPLESAIKGMKNHAIMSE